MYTMMDMEEEHGADLPKYLKVESFIASRFKELQTLTNLMKNTNRVTSVFQRLPKRMRRRAMSHTVKRIPKNLRVAHKKQLLQNKALKKSKNKRKLHRRRPKQLLLEYNRRQKNKLWLETHIWHAKRFHMVSKWGYKLADRSYEKTFKASYRAMKSHCLVQDISYYSCIEVTGFVSDLIEGMKTMVSPECGLSIGAKCWLNGNREGTVTLFHSHRYPHDVIGRVTFMWKPSTETYRTVWLWCHPSFYHEVLDELIDVFKLKPVESDDVEMETKQMKTLSKKRKKENVPKDVERLKINLKNVPSCKIQRYFSSEKNVVVSSLKDTLNRFSLRGPLSNAVLSKALHPAELFDHVLTTSDDVRWWKMPEEQGSTSASTFYLLEKYSFPSQFPSHVILGGAIVDPRLFLKRKRKKALPSNEENEYCLSIPTSSSNCMIWDSSIRDQASLMKFPTGKINRLRSELLVPGFDEQLLKTVNTVIPILFIHKPGPTSSSVKGGFGCGWDIIVPANWGMPVWLSLILCGAKPGGFRETMTLQFETQSIPELLPDSQAGVIHYDSIKEDCENLYFRKPPNKRVNFIKYAIPTPFHYPWQSLVEEWSRRKPSNQYFVFRNRAEMLRVRAYIDSCAKRRPAPMPIFSFPTGSLIAVHVTLVSSGALAPFSHICLPTEADLRRRMRDKMFVGPCEPLHADVNRMKRKRLREAQTNLLKRLRRSRVKAKHLRMASGLAARITKRKTSPTAQLVEEYLQASRALWTPSAAAVQLRNHCERQICGFVTTSGFSYMRACTMGMGYVTGESVSMLLELQHRLGCQPMVLTRAPTSLCYRFCIVNVVLF